jgi:hypothetical protein
VSLLELAILPAEAALRCLLEIPGLGRYSAGIIYGQISLPFDAWSVFVMSQLFLEGTSATSRREIDTVISRLTKR